MSEAREGSTAIFGSCRSGARHDHDVSEQILGVCGGCAGLLRPRRGGAHGREQGEHERGEAARKARDSRQSHRFSLQMSVSEIWRCTVSG
jgi:hypothetical protein